MNSPLAPLVEHSGTLGPVGLVALQLMEAVTCILLGLSILSRVTTQQVQVSSRCIRSPPHTSMLNPQPYSLSIVGRGCHRPSVQTGKVNERINVT